MPRMPHVALLIETSRSYGREILRGVRRFVSERGPWSVFVELRSLESKPPPWLKNWKGDGILTRTGSPEIARAVRATAVPAIELRSSRLAPGLPFVGIDNVALGRNVAEHFLARGFRSFGFFEVDSEDYFEQRRDSFIRCIRKAGYECDLFHTSGHRERPAQWEKQQDDLAAWLSSLRHPVAVMACTDQLGFWLLDACKRAGISVPDEVAVVGVENDDTLCTMASPPLSSVPLGGERVGFQAAARLQKLMKSGRSASRPLLLQPLDIVVRQSSDVVAVDDPLLAQAVQYIRDHAADGINVNDILKAVPISRSTLERQFRSVLNHSPNEEINRVRLIRAKQLLAETDMTLDQVAHRSGFRHPQYLCDLFKRSFHQTPGVWRNSQRGHLD